MTTQKQSERDEYISKLRETLAPGDTLHTVLRSVSRSGTSRVIDVYKFSCKDGKVQKDWLSYWVAKACGFTFQDERGKPEGIKISGCGMDMGFAIVYDVGRVLWPEGFAPSTLAIRPMDGKSVNVNVGRGRNAGPMTREEIAELHAKGWLFSGGRNGNTCGWDTDGGYALKQEWL